jgi:hypothetical protein
LQKGENHSATLLGGAQALLDGRRLVFERLGPEPDLLRDLWSMLPVSSRAELWPASFAYGNAHRFDALVVPHATGDDYFDYVRDNEAGDYPEGRYELALHTAIDNADQNEVDALFARRSRSQTVRLGVMLLAVFVLVPLFVLLVPLDRNRDNKDPPKQDKKESQGARDEGLRLPPVAAFAPLEDEERAQLARRLKVLGGRLGVDVADEDSDEALGEALATVDRQADARLRAKKPSRQTGALRDLGPPKRQLRALLWKHGVKDYGEPGLNVAELMERLEEALAKAGLVKEDEQ